MVSTSVCGDGAKGRRGACRGVQVLELLAWRCEPESAAPRLRGPPAPRGVNVSDRKSSLRARCHARSSRAQSKKKKVYDLQAVAWAATIKRSSVD